MIYLDDDAVRRHSTPTGLIEALHTAFAADYEVPHRAHHKLPGDEATLLLMPAWRAREAIGVKVATVIPANATRGRATVDGVYILLEGQTGAVRAILSARALTQLRTAAVSGLAASLLAAPDAATLLMVGTGALAPHLIEAHRTARRIERVLVWGRSEAKAVAVVEGLRHLPCRIEATTDLEAAAAAADIISCATLSTTPLVLSRQVRPGTHIDLVGSFTPAMREVDDALMARARIFVDTHNAFDESGDLIDPVRAGLLDPSQAVDLRSLAQGGAAIVRNPDDITLFKSVGTALSDLAAAEHITNLARDGR